MIYKTVRFCMSVQNKINKDYESFNYYILL